MTFDPEQFMKDERQHFDEEASNDLPAIEAEAGVVARWKTAQAIVEAALGRDRQRFAGLQAFGDDSLVGSYFRAPDPDDPEAEAAWIEGDDCRIVAGIVVSQPFASSSTTIYLVEFFGQEGFTGRQQLFEIDRMTQQRWAFYDTAAWLEQATATQVREEAATE